MITWMCRFLILVFTFNVIAPDLLRAQQATSRPSKEEMETVYVTNMLELSQRYESLNFSSDDKTAAKSYGDLRQILQKADTLTRSAALNFDPIQANFNQINPKLQDTSASGKEFQKVMAETKDSKSAWEEFLANSNQNPDTLDEWLAQMNTYMEMIDPIWKKYGANQDQARYVSTYATEVLLSSLELTNQYAAFNPDLENVVLELLPQAEARIEHKLDSLTKRANLDETAYMEIGTLRTALFKIDQLYKAMGKTNPMMHYPVTQSTATYWACPKSVLPLTLSLERGKDNKTVTLDPLPCLPKNLVPFTSLSLVPYDFQIQRIDNEVQTQEVDNEKLFENFMNDFVKELAVLRNKEEAEDVDVGKVSVLMQYAVKYALETKQTEVLEKIFALYDNDGDKDKMERPFTEIRAVFFDTIIEHFLTAKADPLTVKQVQKLLVKLAHSSYVETSVLAIATAATINDSRVNESGEFYSADAKATPSLSAAGSRAPNYRSDDTNAPYRFTQKDRNLLVRYAMDIIYEAHKRSYYDLDSTQFQTFQDGLAFSIDCLCPVPGGYFDANTRTVKTTTVESVGRAGNERPEQASYFYTSYYTPSGDPLLRPIYYHNPPNTYLQEKELDLEILTFMGETILWALLTPVIAGVAGVFVKAFRMAGKFALALPKAVKVARVTNAAQKVRATMNAGEVLANTERAMATAGNAVPKASELWTTAHNSFKAGKYAQAAIDAKKAATALRSAKVSGQSAELAGAAAELDNMATKALQMDRWQNALNATQQFGEEIKILGPEIEKRVQEANQLLQKAGKTGQRADYVLAARQAEELATIFDQIAVGNPTMAQELGRISSAFREVSLSAQTFTRAPGVRSFFKAFNQKWATKISQLEKYSNLNKAVSATVQSDAKLGRTVYQTSVEPGYLKTAKPQTTFRLNDTKNLVVRETTLPTVEKATVYDNLRLRDRIFHKPLQYKFSTEIGIPGEGIVRFDTEVARATQGSKLLHNARTLQQAERDLTKLVGARGGKGAQLSVSPETRKLLMQQQQYQRALATNPESVDWWISSDGGLTYSRVSAQEGQRVLSALEKEPEALLNLGKITNAEGKTLELIKKPEVRLRSPKTTGSKALSGGNSAAGKTSKSLAENMRIRVTKPGAINANEVSIYWNKVNLNNATHVKTPLGTTGNELVQDFQAATLYETGVDHVGTFSMDAANAMIDKGFVPQGMLLKEWVTEGTLGTLWASLSGTARFFAKWALIYSPIAGVFTNAYINQITEEQKQEAIEKIGNPRVEKVWSTLMQQTGIKLPNPLHKMLSVMAAKNPLFDPIHHEADIFTAPIEWGMYASDKLFGTNLTPDMQIYEQMQQVEQALDRNDAFANVLKNTDKVMNKTTEQHFVEQTKGNYLTSIADIRAVVKSLNYATYGGALPDAPTVFAQDLQNIYTELDQWEKDINQLSGSAAEQVDQLLRLKEEHDNKISQLNQIYATKCAVLFEAESAKYDFSESIDKLIAAYGTRTNDLEKDLSLARVIEINEQALQTIESWEPLLGEMTLEEIKQKRQDLDRETRREVDRSISNDFVKQLSPQEKGRLLTIAADVGIDGITYYHLQHLANLFENADGLLTLEEAETFADEMREIRQHYSTSLPNILPDSFTDNSVLTRASAKVNTLRFELNNKLQQKYDEVLVLLDKRYREKASSFIPAEEENEQDELYQNNIAGVHSQAY